MNVGELGEDSVSTGLAGANYGLCFSPFRFLTVSFSADFRHSILSLLIAKCRPWLFGEGGLVADSRDVFIYKSNQRLLSFPP